MYAMGDEYLKVYEQMSAEVKAVFDAMPADPQLQYIRYWIECEDRHRSHRDTLPAFRAGWDAGQNDLLRRFNVRVQDLVSGFVASLFEDQAKRRRRAG